MASLTTTHTTQVNVDAATNYFLTVVIGNGQTGSSTFRNPAGKLVTPDIINSALGKGADLKGTSFDVGSQVTEINPDNLTLIVTYYVTDHIIDMANIGAETATDSATFDAQANDTVSFTTTLNFV